MICCRQGQARAYDRGEIDEDGIPKSVRRWAVGYRRAPARAHGRQIGGFEGFQGGSTPVARPISAIFRRMFGRASAARGPSARPDRFRRAAGPPKKSADMTTAQSQLTARSRSAPADHAAAADHLSQAAKGSGRHRSRLAGKGGPVPGGNGDAIVTSRMPRTRSTPATMTTSASICRSRSKRRCSAPRSRCRPRTGR